MCCGCYDDDEDDFYCQYCEEKHPECEVWSHPVEKPREWYWVNTESEDLRAAFNKLYADEFEAAFIAWTEAQWSRPNFAVLIKDENCPPDRIYGLAEWLPVKDPK